MKGKPIYELPVYCGALKIWRVLNLSSGTVYSNHYETLELAIASIDNGAVRADCDVKATTLEEINDALNNIQLYRDTVAADFRAQIQNLRQQPGSESERSGDRDGQEQSTGPRPTRKEGDQHQDYRRRMR